jgi:tetratricopeptide (TPR) repeat protein
VKGRVASWCVCLGLIVAAGGASSAGRSTLTERYYLNRGLLHCLRTIAPGLSGCGLQRWVGTDSGDARTLYHLGRDAAASDRPQDAIQPLMKLWQRSPGDPLVGLQLGIGLAASGDPEAALRVWRQAQVGRYFLERGQVHANEQDLARAASIGLRSAGDYYTLGDAWRQLGRQEAAAAAYDASLQFDDGQSGVHMLAQARLLEIAGRWTEAIHVYERADASGNGGVAPCYQIATIYRENQKDLSAALEWYIRCTRVDPHYLWGYIGAGEMSLALGRYDEALAWFDLAARRFPTSGFPLLFIGHVRAQLGQLDEAQRQYLAATRVEPSNFWPWYHAGLTALRRGDAEAAVRFLERAHELNPAFEDIARQLKIAKAANV